MSKWLFALAGMAACTIVMAQGVGVNETGASPHASAILDASSTDKGFLPPRMTTAQRNAIVGPADGLLIFNTDTGCPNYRSNGMWYEWCGTLPPGLVATLDCAGAFHSGTLTSGQVAIGVSSDVAYTGGIAGPHNGQIVNSTGVTGLTATLSSGSFVNGSGVVTYQISGTPAASGTASFALNIGSQTCTLIRSVVAPPFVCGSSQVEFSYAGSPVSFGTVSRNYSGLSAPHNAQGTRCWMDRNLGAIQVATGNNDVLAYGDLFQWGRGVDGHQIRTSPTTSTLSISDTPGNNSFILNNAGNYDWRNPQNDNLWQGTGGANNPCPAGWRVPTFSELEAERASWTTQNVAGAFASPLKWPSAGYRRRDSGALQGEGTNGYYWAATTDSPYAYSLSIGTGASTSLDTRAAGNSVRCIKD
jgi:hypothetical protein